MLIFVIWHDMENYVIEDVIGHTIFWFLIF